MTIAFQVMRLSMIKILELSRIGPMKNRTAQKPKTAMTQGFLGSFLCSAAAMAALELLRIFLGVFTQKAALSVLLAVAIKEFLWTLAWTPLVYLVFHHIFKKVGLDKLA